MMSDSKDRGKAVLSWIVKKEDGSRFLGVTHSVCGHGDEVEFRRDPVAAAQSWLSMHDCPGPRTEKVGL